MDNVYPQAPQPMGSGVRPAPSFIDSVKETLTLRYAQFTGRARRSEYWYFVLANLVASFAANLLDRIWGVPVIACILSLALLIPGLAVCVRRLHDLGKSGWWVLLAFIPLVGAIILIVWFCQDGDRQPNEYGPSPKYN